MDNYLSKSTLSKIAAETTPIFVYSMSYVRDRAAALLSQKTPFGMTVRYAVKANPHREFIALLHEVGCHFDASSSYEATELLAQNIPGNNISLSSQQPAHNLSELLNAGVKYVATSLRQLELFVAHAQPGGTVGLRINPGLGAGHNNRTTTGGANSSFGLWAAYVPDALKLALDNSFIIDRLHIHIGSGADPKTWQAVMQSALSIVRDMPDVTQLDIGGGYKIHRFGDEPETDMTDIITVFSAELEAFANETGRHIHLEIEPGTWLVGHAGVLLSSVTDIVDTGKDGHTFLRIDTGMNDILRPSMYGAQHKISILSDSSERERYVVVGHNCETGDILTPASADPESIEPRLLNKAEIGDIVAIYDAGAYCASMSAKGYNSFPSAREVTIE